MKYKIIQITLIFSVLLTAAFFSYNETHASPSTQPQYGNQDADSAPVMNGTEIWVFEDTGTEAVCRAATPEEVLAFTQTPPGVEMHFISPIRPNQTGLQIMLRGTQQLETFPAAKAAFIKAAAVWESFIQSPVTIVLDVDFGPTRFGSPFGSSNILGSTASPTSAVSYPTVRSALISSASTADEAAIYNALPAFAVPTDFGDVNTIVSSLPVFRALGLLPQVANPSDPTPSIGFNSNFSFDLDPSNGIDRDKTDFDAVAVHEIGHALGFISRNGGGSVSLSIWDIFRFNPGVTISTFSTARRVLAAGGVQVFFAGGPQLPLSTGGPSGSGGDGRQSSHWRDDDLMGGVFIGIMDPTIGPGRREEVTVNDRAAINAFGYRIAGQQVDLTPPTVSVSSPRGREELKGGDRFSITWQSQDNVAIARHDIALSTDAGMTFPITIATGLSGAAREFLWTVPQIDAAFANIRVTAIDGSNNQGIGINVRPFSITKTSVTSDYSISFDPASQEVKAGGSLSFTIGLQSVGGFNQPVNLNVAVSQQNSNITTSLSSRSITPGSISILTVNTSLNTPVSAFTITVTGASGQLVRTATAVLNVLSAADFALAVTPNSQTISSGSSASFSISAQAINGFNQPIVLSADFSPQNGNITTALSSNMLAPGGNVMLTVNAAAAAPTSAFNIAVTGTAGQIVRTATATISVIAPDFSLAFSPSQVAVARGKKGQFTVNINRVGGFNGNVTVTAPDTAPLKIKITQPTLSTTGATLSFDFKIKKKALVGAQQLTFTGRDDAGRVRMAVLTLIIQ